MGSEEHAIYFQGPDKDLSTCVFGVHFGPPPQAGDGRRLVRG